MQTIWKFSLELTERQQLSIPSGAKFLHFEIQNGQLCVWYQVDPTADIDLVVYAIVGTGHALPEGSWMHLGTTLAGEYVWHLYKFNGYAN